MTGNPQGAYDFPIRTIDVGRLILYNNGNNYSFGGGKRLESSTHCVMMTDDERQSQKTE